MSLEESNYWFDLDDIDDFPEFIWYIEAEDSSANNVSGNELMQSIDLGNMSSSMSAPPDTATDNLNVKMQLNCRIKEKMKSEGRELTSVDQTTDSKDNQLTEEDKQRRMDKKERNKEAARRSRDKKKEDELKLREQNRLLVSENQQLKSSVSQWKIRNEVVREYIEKLECLVGNSIHQQEHGDDMDQETGSNSANQTYRSLTFTEKDDKYITRISEDLEDLELQKPQPVQHILCSLCSQTVTSSGSYRYDDNLNQYRIGTGIQESIGHNNVSNFTENVRREVSFEVGETQNEINLDVQGNRSLLNSHVPSTDGISPWFTNRDMERESREASEAVLAVMQPPPEKKPRLE